MIKRILNFIDNLDGSFKILPGGYSGRKVSGAWATIVATAATFVFGSAIEAAIIIGIWLTYSLLCQGLVTVQQLIELKNSFSITTKTEEKVEGQKKETKVEEVTINPGKDETPV